MLYFDFPNKKIYAFSKINLLFIYSKKNILIILKNLYK